MAQLQGGNDQVHPKDDPRSVDELILVGLARRGDRRMVPALRKELASDSVGRLAVEAPALIGDPALHPLLVALRDWWDVDEGLLGEAIDACSPRPEVSP